MTDRRPHWDDDVITAVMSALPEQAKRVVGANDVFRIIAAVEDWHERKGEENLPLLMAMMNAESTKFRRRAEQAEATIQRVRELHRPSRSTIWSHNLQQAITVTTCQQCGSDQYPCPTIKALDGE